MDKRIISIWILIHNSHPKYHNNFQINLTKQRQNRCISNRSKKRKNPSVKLNIERQQTNLKSVLACFLNFFNLFLLNFSYNYLF
jgi:hypothetical protein